MTVTVLPGRPESAAASRHRHPLCAAVAAALLAAAAVTAVLFLIVVPAVTAVSTMPGQLGRAYVDYYDGVGRQIQQVQQQGGGMP